MVIIKSPEHLEIIERTNMTRKKNIFNSPCFSSVQTTEVKANKERRKEWHGNNNILIGDGKNKKIDEY